MKRLAFTIFFGLATILCLMAQDKKVSEFQQRYRFTLSDRIPIISTNGSGGFTNYTISGQNLLDSLGGLITNNISIISNSVTTIATNLLNVTIVTNYLDHNGDTIRFVSAGAFANNANAKSVFVALGGTVLFQSTNIQHTYVGTNGWRVVGDIVRLGPASYVSSIELTALGSSINAGVYTNYSSATTTLGVESLATNNTLYIQTRGIAQGDNTNYFLKLYNIPFLAP